MLIAVGQARRPTGLVDSLAANRHPGNKIVSVAKALERRTMSLLLAGHIPRRILKQIRKEEQTRPKICKYIHCSNFFTDPYKPGCRKLYCSESCRSAQCNLNFIISRKRTEVKLNDASLTDKVKLKIELGDYSVMKNGEILISTGVYFWKDGAMYDKPEKVRSANG